MICGRCSARDPRVGHECWIDDAKPCPVCLSRDRRVRVISRDERGYVSEAQPCECTPRSNSQERSPKLRGLKDIVRRAFANLDSSSVSTRDDSKRGRG